MHEPVKVTINCYCTKLAIFLQYCLWDLVSEGSFVSLKTLSVLLCCHLDIPLMFPWKLPSSWMSLYSPCCLLRYMFFFPIAVKACRRGLKKNPCLFSMFWLVRGSLAQSRIQQHAAERLQTISWLSFLFIDICSSGSFSSHEPITVLTHIYWCGAAFRHSYSPEHGVPLVKLLHPQASRYAQQAELQSARRHQHLSPSAPTGSHAAKLRTNITDIAYLVWIFLQVFISPEKSSSCRSATTTVLLLLR